MHYRSEKLLLIILAIAISASRAPAAQRPEPIRQIGVLSPFLNRENLFFDTLKQELARLGYVEGKNLNYVHRASESFDELSRHAVEMVRLKVDIIVTEGPQGVRAAGNATTTIPIVIGNIGDAVNQGFVASLAKPGGNVTGLSSLNAELSGKRLELLRDTLPKLARFAVLREAIGDAYPLRTIERAAQVMKLKPVVFQVRDADEIASAFTAMTSAKVGGLELMPGSTFVSRMRDVIDLTERAKLAAIFPDSRFVKNGALMSYGPNVVDQYKRAAVYVDKILKGTKPSDLPVEQPMAFEFVINLKTANAIGLKIPPDVLMRATQIIK